MRLPYKPAAVIFVSLVFLFVCLFGAYAYGAATYSEPSPLDVAVGHGQDVSAGDSAAHRQDQPGDVRHQHGVVRAACADRVRDLTGASSEGWLDLGTFMAFLFPPIIMHTVYLEAHSENSPTPRRDLRLADPRDVRAVAGRRDLAAAAIFKVVPRPEPIGAWIGGSIGLMFTISSLFSTGLMMRRERRALDAGPAASAQRDGVPVRGADPDGSSSLMFMRQERLVVAVLDRAARSAPIYFMIASVYFEDRFAFYDLVLKRGLLLLLSVAALALALTRLAAMAEALPGGLARPWLFAVALAPVAMVMPWLHVAHRALARSRVAGPPIHAGRCGQARHRRDAAGHRRGDAGRRRRGALSEIFGARIMVLWGSRDRRRADRARGRV